MKITLGKTANDKPVAFDLDTLISTRLLIQANSGAGKSYLLRKLMEQLFGHIQIIAIDPEGEFATLREKYGFVLVGKGGETPADPRIAADVAEKLLEIRAPAICDLYEMKPADRHRWVHLFLEAMINAPKKLWHPVIVVVDEAHVFCPEKGAGESEAKEAMIDLSTRGRKRGFCPVWATQRLAKVDKDASSVLQNRLVGGTFEDVDIRRALDLLSIAPEEKRAVTQQLKTLDPGWFFAFGRAIAKERVLFKVGAVETSHPKPGSAKHASEPPPTPDQVRNLLPKLADLPQVAEEKARTLDELRAKVRSLLAELAAEKRERAPAPGIDAKAFKQAVQETQRKALAERDEQWRRALEEYQERVEKVIGETASKSTGAIRAIKFALPVAAKARIEPLPLEKPAPTERHSSVPMTTAVTRPAPAESNGAVTRPQSRILAAIAEFEAIGRPQVPKKWIAALSGASHSSSSFTNNLGSLRSHSYIDYPQPGVVALTETGRALVPPVVPPASSDEMLARCKEIVSAPQGAILQVLHDTYPHPMDKTELAERAGASATSSSFTNNLGALRSAGMIDYPEQGKARAADWIFLE